ncbi:MAG: TadA family conjugal transfer-associated ATPase [Bifidobacteriaceae bacterium]|jgi:pilus assembly protein CpaF|nr:TadA family conjugal transfer-associated ATPase [Bifidobacteriaceae bacterium]
MGRGVVGVQVAAAAPLMALLENPEVTDVLVNGPHGVWVDGPDGLRATAIAVGSAQEIRRLACQLASVGGKRLDDACPAADVPLPGGLRMHAILPPVAPDGPLISLRIARRDSFTLAELTDRGTMPTACADLMRQLVAERVNFLICGATGTGKTTLLSALLGLVPPTERILLIEEAAEISADHRHLIRLEARTANSEGRGEFTLAQLVRQAVRMRPDRIVLGECRGAEVRDVLTALNTGHEGSCATLHANTARDVPARLSALGALAGMNPQAVAAQVAAALSAVIHLRRDRTTGRREVTQIAAIRSSGQSVTTVPAVIVRSSATEKGPGWGDLAERCGW